MDILILNIIIWMKIDISILNYYFGILNLYFNWNNYWLSFKGFFY
jgi:hypothetical protein